MCNCSWLPRKLKIIFAMDTSRKCEKVGMEEGIMPIKSLRAGWRRKTFQTRYLMWNCSWLPRKWKRIFAMNTNRKCESVGMEQGITPIKSLRVRLKRGTYTKKISCLELFLATRTKKQFSEWTKKSTAWNLKVRIEEGTVKQKTGILAITKCLSTTKD